VSAQREKTRQRILKALETLLLEKGFPAVGINAIARQAGCDKVLIYRYFDGLDGLLQSFAEQADLWWSVAEIWPDDSADVDLPEFLHRLLQQHIEAIRQRPLTQEVMAWEMSEYNNLTRALARRRADQGVLLVKRVRQQYDQPSIDLGGILGILGAAVNYLVMRTRHVPLEHVEAEWWRLDQAISSLLTCNKSHP